MYTILILSLIVMLSYWLLSAVRRNIKTQTKKLAFPKDWKLLLINHIRYYNHLSEENKLLFEERILLFLDDKKITGVDVTVDDLTKLEVACSAVIPAFAFQGYNYPHIREVLLYQDTFDDHFLNPTQPIKHHNIEGMVGEGVLSQVVMLKKGTLLSGFENNHKENVGIHEFTHLLDKTDGVSDGIPQLLVNKDFTIPWLKVMHLELQSIKDGTSDMSPYALTNEAEFLAVASEYFFSSPDVFKTKHPELLKYLQQIFHQDLSSSTSAIVLD